MIPLIALLGLVVIVAALVSLWPPARELATTFALLVAGLAFVLIAAGVVK